MKGETKGGDNSEDEGRDERRGNVRVGVRVKVERGEPVNLNSKLVNSFVGTKRR